MLMDSAGGGEGEGEGEGEGKETYCSMHHQSCQTPSDSICIVIRELGDTDHGAQHLRQEVESAGQQDDDENGSDGVLQQLNDWLRYGVDGSGADRERVQDVPPDVVPELLHQRAFGPQGQSLALRVDPHEKKHDAERSATEEQPPRELSGGDGFLFLLLHGCRCLGFDGGCCWCVIEGC